MDQALRVECSDEIYEAVSPPRDEELFRVLNGKMKTVADVEDGLKAVVSAIPDIQDDIEHIEKTLAELVSHSKSIVMALGSSAARGGPLSDEKISKHLLPVSTVVHSRLRGSSCLINYAQVFAYSIAACRPSRGQGRPATRRLQKYQSFLYEC
jgi:ABC-type transporter Mla subunit MlaD